MNYEQIGQWIQAQGIKLFQGLIVLAVGLFLVHWLLKLMDRKQSIFRLDPTLRGFLDNLIRLVLYVLVFLTAASVMGIPMTSIITLVASAGVAVSLAMQGALSNLVGGLTLLILKPIKVDEYVKVGDIEGTVRRIGAFYTEMNMPDNRHISMPNSNLTNTAIINYTRLGTRRLDLFFNVGYQSDVQHVKDVLMGVVRRHDTVLPDPAPIVRMNECGDSAIKFVVRLWCKTGDYWPLFFDLLEEGKTALDQAGIQIPYPQMDVHVN